MTLVLFRVRRLTPSLSLEHHPGVASEKALASTVAYGGPCPESPRWTGSSHFEYPALTRTSGRCSHENLGTVAIGLVLAFGFVFASKSLDKSRGVAAVSFVGLWLV